MKKSLIISKFNNELDEEELESIDLFNYIEEKNKFHNSEITKLNDYIKTKLSELNNKIIETDMKINSAIFGDKKFVNESYAFDIPLEENYFINPESMTFEDGILTNKVNKTSQTEKINLDVKNITSLKNTDFKFSDNKLQIFKNYDYPYQEIEINFNTSIISGFLNITLNKTDNISILDSYGKKIIENKITNKINLPINEDMNSIIIRFDDNKYKEFIIQEFYITKFNFELENEITTKLISINQNLKQIGINTCDNYSNKYSDIQYYISINKKPFKLIRPLNKQKNLDIDSIIYTDTEYSNLKLSDSVELSNKTVFLLSDLQPNSIDIDKSFEYKLGDNIYTLINNEFYFYCKNDVNIKLNKTDKFYLNNILIENQNDLSILKGFNKFTVDSLLWNQKENLEQYKIINVEEDKLTLQDKTNGDILIKNSNKNESLFLKLFTEGDILLNEIKPNVYFENQSMYLEKYNNNDLFIYFKYKNILVETIQIKIILKTLKQNNPVYVSTLTVRGV